MEESSLKIIGKGRVIIENYRESKEREAETLLFIDIQIMKVATVLLENSCKLISQQTDIYCIFQ